MSVPYDGDSGNVSYVFIVKHLVLSIELGWIIADYRLFK